tara:strand:+ start:133 stop:432 length:300 start_codon:yes stop_codon:yes gene_type:complete
MTDKKLIKNLKQIAGLLDNNCPSIATERIHWLIQDVKDSPIMPKQITIEDYPDAKKHQTISFVKSGIRILGYGLLLVSLEAAVGFLILSELVGIYEELV